MADDPRDPPPEDAPMRDRYGRRVLDDEYERRRLRAIAWEENEARIREIAREVAREESVKVAEDRINDYSIRVWGIDWKNPTPQPIPPGLILRRAGEELVREDKKRAEDDARRARWGAAMLSGVISLVVAAVGFVASMIWARWGISS